MFYVVNEEEGFRFISLLFWTLSNCSYLENLTFSKTFIALTVIETADFNVMLRFVLVGVKFLHS